MEQDDLMREIRNAINTNGKDPEQAAKLMEHIQPDDRPLPQSPGTQMHKRREVLREDVANAAADAGAPVAIDQFLSGVMGKRKKRTSKADFLSQIHSLAGEEGEARETFHDPEADARLCAALKGEVHISYGLTVLCCMVPGCIGALWVFFGVMGVSFGMLFFGVLCLAAAVLLYWYLHRWELSFDGSSGWFRYRDREGKELRFHVSEIFDTQYVEKPHQGKGRYDRILVLNVDGTEIRIHTGTFQTATNEPLEFSFMAHTGHKKLEDYLEAYDRLKQQG
ncbi:MAG: hypothetical protein IJ055_04615 [Oscillospiraceae bacterium]|nr:hypothetical protein [Oscillospiraceae bacterium]